MPQTYGDATLVGYKILRDGQQFGHILGSDAVRSTISSLKPGKVSVRPTESWKNVWLLLGLPVGCPSLDLPFSLSFVSNLHLNPQLWPLSNAACNKFQFFYYRQKGRFGFGCVDVTQCRWQQAFQYNYYLLPSPSQFSRDICKRSPHVTSWLYCFGMESTWETHQYRAATLELPSVC